MRKLFNSLPITGIAKTITDVMGVDAPKQAAPSIEIITEKAKSVFGNQRAERVFIFNPDAVALWLLQKYTAWFQQMFLDSDVQIPLLSVMPCVTPVCFASMYTGAMPGVHGIEEYEKPVLRTDTVFDALLRAGFKPAIVSVPEDSIPCIFLERQMDYFLYDTYDECNKKALELIEEDKHDLIVLYNGNYDIAMHRSGPESGEALGELKRNIETFSAMSRHIQKHWGSHRVMLGFCPDHGCHEIDGNLGSHGLDVPDDMNVVHFFSFGAGR